ncbi:MAG: ABC transporter permease [Christensenellales bacterium]|jgi:NitT/TauT family transport system permease protein
MSNNAATAKAAPISEEHARYWKQIRRRNRFIMASRISLALIIIGLWELAAHMQWIDPFIMSSPSRIVRTIASLYRSGDLFMHIGVTLWETAAGFVLGTLLGIGIAVLLWWLPAAAQVLDPYLVVLNSLPKIALGPVIIVWVGAGAGAIITMALLISVIVTVLNVLNAFLEVSEEKILLVRTFGATRAQILRLVVLPASIPAMISTLKINVGMTWVGVIVGEYLVSRAGLGYLIVYGGQVFKLDLVMASILILAVVAAIMYLAIAHVEKKYNLTHR